MTHRTFISVDPGAAGSVAWSNRQGIFVEPMPDTRRGVFDLAKRATDGAVHPVCYIEKIAPYIPGGGASSMFIFGQNVERIGCAFEFLGVRIVEIIPRTWQKVLGLGNSDRIRATPDMDATQKKSVTDWNAKAKRDWKNKLKAEAERRFPDQRVTLKTCDALLLLDVAIQLESGRQPTQQSLIP